MWGGRADPTVCCGLLAPARRLQVGAAGEGTRERAWSHRVYAQCSPTANSPCPQCPPTAPRCGGAAAFGPAASTAFPPGEMPAEEFAPHSSTPALIIGIESGSLFHKSPELVSCSPFFTRGSRVTPSMHKHRVVGPAKAFPRARAQTPSTEAVGCDIPEQSSEFQPRFPAGTKKSRGTVGDTKT